MKRQIAGMAIVVAIATLAATPLVEAGPRDHRRHGMRGGSDGPGFPGGRLSKLREELNLSEGQVEQIRGFFAEVREQNAQQREQRRGGLRSVTQVLLANPDDLAGAQAVLDRKAAAERAMKTRLMQATAKAIAVLTPEQRTKLAELMKDREARRRARSRRH